MSLLSSTTVLGLIDSMAIVLSQAYQLARGRLASSASPILRLLVQHDQAISETDLLRGELENFRIQREGLQPPRRPDIEPRSCWRSCSYGDVRLSGGRGERSLSSGGPSLGHVFSLFRSEDHVLSSQRPSVHDHVHSCPSGAHI